MSSVVNKSKNKFVPKAKARPRPGAPQAPPISHPAPAHPSYQKPVEDAVVIATLKSIVPEARGETPTIAPTIQEQQQQEQQNEAHELAPRPRSGIPGLRTTSAVPAVIPSTHTTSDEEHHLEPVSRAQGIPAIKSSVIRTRSSATSVPTLGLTSTSDGDIVDEGVGAETAKKPPQTKGRPKSTRIKGNAHESKPLDGEEGEEHAGEEEEADDITEDSEFVQQPPKRKTPQKRKPKTAPDGAPPTKKKATPRKKRPTVESSDSEEVTADGEGARRTAGESESSTIPKAKKKRILTRGKPPTTPKPRGTGKPRGRRRAESPEDGEAQEIATNVVKMKDLCRDMRVGKKSKRFFELQQMDFIKLAKEQEEQAEKERRIRNGEEEEGEGHETTEQRLERLASERSRRTMNAPQMRIVNGQIVLDDESLHIDRRERDAVDESIMEVVEESQNSRLVNSQTWSKREKVEKWDAASTEKFYEALSMFGTDFEIISRMFVGRSRRQMRNKFNNEERKHPERITAALRTRISVNIEEYSVMADQQFPEPQELEDELQKLREAHEADELAAAGHAVAMEKERQEVANALMHEGDNAVAVEHGKKTRKKKGAKGKAGAGQEEEVLTMTREEYEVERARELAEAEDM